MDDPSNPTPPPAPTTILAMTDAQRISHAKAIGDVAFANQTIQELVGKRATTAPRPAAAPVAPAAPVASPTTAPTEPTPPPPVPTTIREMSPDQRVAHERAVGNSAYVAQMVAELRGKKIR